MNQKELFRDVYDKQEGRCFVTGKYIPLEYAKAHNFMHILGKGAYSVYKYRIDNVLFVDERIHQIYDCEDTEKLYVEYSEFKDKIDYIFDKKDRLKYEYYTAR